MQNFLQYFSKDTDVLEPIAPNIYVYANPKKRNWTKEKRQESLKKLKDG